MKIKHPSVLFITYDGLLDSLGSSQILPYIQGIAKHPRPVHILSFEKKDLSQHGSQHLRDKLNVQGIEWTFLTFTKKFGFWGKFWDLLRMYFYGFLISILNDINIVHARSHAAAQVGLMLKKFLGVKLIFDFRGLWVDERVDKGGWDLNIYFHRIQYKIFKKIESVLLKESDQIVVLTKAVTKEIVKLGADQNKLTVIPCCADFNHFLLSTPSTRFQARQKLKITNSTLVFGYLGSVGRMYMPEFFIRFIEVITKKRNDVCILVITPDVTKFENEMNKYLSPSLHKIVKLQAASRDEIPQLLSAIDLLVAFIMPSYARIASSPTKIAESFAVGIPVISNYGVGDVSSVIQQINGGLLIDVNKNDALEDIVAEIPTLLKKGGVNLRERARKLLDLNLADSLYREVYSKIELSINLKNYLNE